MTARKPRTPRRKPATPQTPDTIAVYAEPRWRGPDAGEGGIRQVMEHVAPHMERLGIVYTDDHASADLITWHATPQPATKRYIEAHPEVPAIAHCHGLYWDDYQWDRGSLSANGDVIEGLRLADAATAPTEWVAQAIRRGISTPITVVPHGVDAAEWEPLEPDESSYILYDKTRHEPDGVCDSTPAIALARLMPHRQFVLCTAPTELAVPNIEVTGRLPYAQASLLTRKAALYLCITRETFGLATLQAMAAGVPVVGFRFGGQAEIIRDEADGGILVEPGDVDALAYAVERATAERDALGAAARRRAIEDYPWERAAGMYAALYRETVAAKRAQYAAGVPRVSVLICNYNMQQWVGEAIASATAQGPDVQVIVVDDASTDDSLKVIAQHTERVLGLAQEDNRYLAASRNHALENARGRYVMALDADDKLAPDAIATLAGALDADRTAQIAYGKVHFTDEHGEPMDYGMGPGRSAWPFPYDNAYQVKGDNVTCLPYASMVRRDWLVRAGGWRERCRTGEDIDLWQRLIMYGARPKMVTQADFLVYRTRTDSMSVSEPLGPWSSWYPWTDAAGKWCTPPFGCPGEPPDKRAWPVAHHAEPLVSVIIPVGPGHGRAVVDAVDSVEAQTFRRWECIVVDDTHGEGLAPLPGWARRLVQPEGVSGAADARNAGLAASQAPYVVFLDADDYLVPHALRYMMQAIDSNPGLGCVYPDAWYAETAEDRAGKVQWSYKIEPLAPWNCRDAIDAKQVHGVTAIYRTEAVRAVGGFDVDAPWEDADLQAALSVAGHCSAYLGLALYVYRLPFGKRRTETNRDRAATLAWLRTKWDDYLSGRKAIMGCACTSGSGSVTVSAPTQENGAQALTGAMLEVEYLGGATAPFSVKGPKSGAFYRFARDSQHLRKPVLVEDMAWFAARPDQYRVIDASAMLTQEGATEPPIVAPGSPRGRR